MIETMKTYVKCVRFKSIDSTKCEAERINEKQSFTNEDIQELDCIFNT